MIRLGILIVMLVPAALTAQAKRACPPVDSTVLLPCQADQPPIPALDRVLPWDLASITSVTIRVRYVIDTLGHVQRGSLKIIGSSNAFFARGMDYAASRWTFTPARYAGRRVPIRYEEVFVFHRPADPDVPMAEGTAFLRDTMRDGIPRTMLWHPDRDPAALIAFDNQDLLTAQRSVIATLVREARLDSTRSRPLTLCIALRRAGAEVSADSETLRPFRSPQRRVLAFADCPQTYVHMIQTVDSLGRSLDPVPPPGWIEPWRLVITKIDPWARDRLLVTAEVGQGLGGEDYRCWVIREGADWRSLCDGGSFFVH